MKRQPRSRPLLCCPNGTSICYHEGYFLRLEQRHSGLTGQQYIGEESWARSSSLLRRLFLLVEKAANPVWDSAASPFITESATCLLGHRCIDPEPYSTCTMFEGAHICINPVSRCYSIQKNTTKKKKQNKTDSRISDEGNLQIWKKAAVKKNKNS